VIKQIYPAGFEFKPQDLWIGVYWKYKEERGSYATHWLHLHITIIPVLPYPPIFRWSGLGDRMGNIRDLLYAGVILLIAAIPVAFILAAVVTGLSFGWHLGAFFVGLL